MSKINVNPWALGAVELDGKIMPVALIISMFQEARAAFDNELEEMETELGDFAAKNPHLDHITKKKEARINRLEEMFRAYDYMIAMQAAEVERLKRALADLKKATLHPDDIAPRNPFAAFKRENLNRW